MEEVKALARKMGFEISVSMLRVIYAGLMTEMSRDKNEREVQTTYTNNSRSMLGYVYHASFWTATKLH